MDKYAVQQQERGQRVDVFAGENPTLFVSGHAAEDIAVVRAALTDLQALAGAQSAQGQSASGATSSKSTLAAHLEAELRAISRTAKRIKKRHPEITVDFDLPSSQSDSALLQTAQAFITNATPIQNLFIERGMDANFIAELQDDLTQYSALLTAQQSGDANRSTATAAIAAAVERLIDAIDDLDDLMKNKLSGNAPLLAAWKRAATRGKIRRDPHPPAPPSA